VALVFIGWAALSTPHRTAEEIVYFSALFVVTLGLVGRTAVLSSDALHYKSVAEIDTVTGSANTRGIDDRMEELVTASRRLGQPFTAVIVDLDDFTKIHSAHGSMLGDRLLQQVASGLSGAVGTAALFRLAGDRFLALVPCDSRAAADAIARGLVATVDSVEFDGVRVCASAGYAVCPYDSVDPAELVPMAESALGWAKYHGKHRVVAHDMDILIALTSQERELLADRPAQLQVARALAAAADAHDPGNYRHARNVASLSVLFAREIGVDPDEIARIELAAMLHDIGKMAVPTSGSSRAVRTDEVAGRKHAEFGGFMVESLDVDGVSDWVRSHHERWDGNGYPDGLQGDRIPLASRIISLADAYDAMTSGGYGRAPRSKLAALQEIDLGLGARFDPGLGERFIALVGTRDALGWRDEWTAA